MLYSEFNFFKSEHPTSKDTHKSAKNDSNQSHDHTHKKKIQWGVLLGIVVALLIMGLGGWLVVSKAIKRKKEDDLFNDPLRGVSFLDDALQNLLREEEVNLPVPNYCTDNSDVSRPLNSSYVNMCANFKSDANKLVINEENQQYLYCKGPTTDIRACSEKLNCANCLQTPGCYISVNENISYSETILPNSTGSPSPTSTDSPELVSDSTKVPTFCMCAEQQPPEQTIDNTKWNPNSSCASNAGNVADCIENNNEEECNLYPLAVQGNPYGTLLSDDDIEYELGSDKPGEPCPDGKDIMDQGECKMAADLLLKLGKIEKRSKMWTGTTNTKLPWCSILPLEEDPWTFYNTRPLFGPSNSFMSISALGSKNVDVEKLPKNIGVEDYLVAYDMFEDANDGYVKRKIVSVDYYWECPTGYKSTDENSCNSNCLQQGSQAISCELGQDAYVTLESGFSDTVLSPQRLMYELAPSGDDINQFSVCKK